MGARGLGLAHNSPVRNPKLDAIVDRQSKIANKLIAIHEPLTTSH